LCFATSYLFWKSHYTKTNTSKIEHITQQPERIEYITQQPKASQVGRFQIFRTEINIFSEKTGKLESAPVVFMLDTITGVTKQFESGITNEGELIQGWLPSEK
jgi:hypothetical protein